MEIERTVKLDCFSKLFTSSASAFACEATVWAVVAVARELLIPPSSCFVVSAVFLASSAVLFALSATSLAFSASLLA